MVEIYDVIEGSEAALAGIKRGDFLISINGHTINDVLDYSFYLAEKTVTLKIHRGSELFDVRIKKSEYADIGLEFKTFLMDEKRSCRNKCVFCFIDQNPKGMRDTIYFKDDDTRLSFLQGCYVTLTNMSDEDIERIVKMKTSPINISVHTTNPVLRERMLCNRHAGKILDYMKRFAEAGIMMNCQIVLCRGLNDNAELERTMDDLSALYPHVSSVSIVPAGLTCHRQGLYPLEPFSAEECGKIIDTVEKRAAVCLKKLGSRLFFCSDEFYLKAERPTKIDEYYEGYPQLDNGVGLITSMMTDFEYALEDVEQYDLNKARKVSIATGAAAYNLICDMVSRLKEVAPNLRCSVYKIENDFYGHDVTVAGLLTGQDIKNQLAEKRLGNILFLPRVTLRAEGDLFLDGMTPTELEWALNVKIKFIENDAAEFIRHILED